MFCPYCNSEDTKVLDKRNSEQSIRRRRECLKCSKRFTTYERIELVDLIIVKKNGTRQAFSRDKLKAGISRACEKRPVSSEAIEKLLDNVESRLRSAKSIEIPSKTIGNLVVTRLKKLDKVAYIRFASVYKDFTDVQDFAKAVKTLK